ncbi:MULTISPECIES: xanthine dehydrogenase small subunit [unclassified Pseudomonas]|uniref:xanthine dehydrogenase small subunit n=1 Tax=unclassified Pseudomonas TaxID=196821 RepID=UPI002AC91214|nr:MULTISPECIES: xanthine dehydrogenase small subunit [unclassified Pseudomonas]MEB0043362.1 xanthine dehydrogenase small subunit [Pseudomonas sp. MH10]MEB0078770.1 xanthine dehydrogenase small subunit [Pseudomonas sp. MH10out]MEB0093756.1 xanthine dehydrogenase small subunit [Pseudomonas sp. CCI4.2]MEB0103027.1 xanthine dehydrogenase small subunit [Pseudomonas sp. CCI3.2]MEB0120360.1 xanthine dehydrogenase small subunit [Pseudomonas sp. CCI1.2]
MIQFLLNQELRTEHALDPNLTVLNYLREHVGKPGTKEGCASGDCGACTVVIGELNLDDNGQEQLRYRSLNSCLTFVASLHGKQLISVEDLKHQGQLHSVQKAMVDCHGSQCGFCTPGFVMSLFALQKNSTEANGHQAHEALAGNLCRCTGYRPILAAAEQACGDQRQPDQFDQREAQTIARLRAIAPKETGELNSGDKRCLVPLTVSDLAELYDSYPQARLLAGGTDLALEVTQFHRTLPVMIYVGNIEAMKRIEHFEDRLEIGAATSLTDCYAALSAEYPDFGKLLQRFASLQIRNQGTLGGNIGNASPIGDSPPLLIALGAQLVLCKGQTRRTLALEDYFIDYRVTARQDSEFIEKIIVPKANARQVFRAYKVSKRLDDDISAVCAAFRLQVENGAIVEARVAFGGMAAIPKRAAACEQALIGAPWTSATVERACAALADDFTPLSDFRASKEYRLLSAQNLLRKYFIELQSPHIETRVTSYV